MIRILLSAAVVLTAAFGGPAMAGDADVVDVRTTLVSPQLYNFDVTVRSKDADWSRYADRIEAVGPDGTIYGTRILEHPHADEQPFTRDLYNVRVPGIVNTVLIRVHFTTSGYDGITMNVSLGGK